MSSPAAQFVTTGADYDELPLGSVVKGTWQSDYFWTKLLNDLWVGNMSADMPASNQCLASETRTRQVVRHGWSEI